MLELTQESVDLTLESAGSGTDPIIVGRLSNIKHVKHLSAHPVDRQKSADAAVSGLKIFNVPPLGHFSSFRNNTVMSQIK